jgi:hypothetical protein
MKQVTILFLLICLVFNVQAQAPKFENGVDYNDYIVTLQNEIGHAIIQFNEVMGRDDATMEVVEPYYKAMVQAAIDAKAKSSAMNAYKGNTELRTAAVSLFTFYVETFSTEYKELLDLVFSGEITEATMVRVNEILASVTEVEGGYDEAFQTAQSNFATQFGFSLEENELQDAIDGNEGN